MRLLLLLAFLFTSTVALAADRQINQISVEQSDSQTIIRLFGSDLIRSAKDRVFFAAEASSYSVEPTMMYGDSEYVEVALGMPVMAGQYRISIGPNENTSNLESMVVIGAIGPQGPAGRDGADGRDGVDGVDGAPGADGQDGMDGADGVDGAKGDPGADGKDGSSCSVTQTTSGATLSCTDGTMASIANGTDGVIGSNGTDGADGQDGADGSSCSVEEIDGGAVVSCTDGSSAVLAGAGSQFYVQPNVEVQPANTFIPSGDIVLKDANDTILGLVVNTFFEKAYRVDRALSIGGFDATYSVRVSEVEGTVLPYLRGNLNYFYYLEEDCLGQPFGAGGKVIQPDFVEGEFRLFASDLTTSRQTILFKSQRFTADGFPTKRSSCENFEIITPAQPLVEVNLPEITQAAAPLSLEQLP